jgi:hypothetical protein
MQRSLFPYKKELATPILFLRMINGLKGFCFFVDKLNPNIEQQKGKFRTSEYQSFLLGTARWCTILYDYK